MGAEVPPARMCLSLSWASLPHAALLVRTAYMPSCNMPPSTASANRVQTEVLAASAM